MVTALDAFADVDTARLSRQLIAISYADAKFDEGQLTTVLADIAGSKPHGFVYGSGFEAQPALLALAERYMPLVGNSVRVVRNIKRALTFFALLEVLRIPHPEFSITPPADDVLAQGGWLQKQNGGSGGTHIRRVCDARAQSHDTYYQREVQGVPVSLLFLADGVHISLIGFNQQWTAPTSLMPFRYGGAVSHAVLPAAVKKIMLTAAQKLTSAVGLRGVNSLDAVMQGERVWILELNPRLTATFDLYRAEQAELFELHMQACRGSLPTQPRIEQRSRAHYIVYAPEHVIIPEGYEWPDWVADIPAAGQVSAGEPLCTVTAEGADAEEAVGQMAMRVRQLVNELIK